MWPTSSTRSWGRPGKAPYNLAGDSAMSLQEIAAILQKPTDRCRQGCSVARYASRADLCVQGISYCSDGSRP